MDRRQALCHHRGGHGLLREHASRGGRRPAASPRGLSSAGGAHRGLPQLGDGRRSDLRDCREQWLAETSRPGGLGAQRDPEHGEGEPQDPGRGGQHGHLRSGGDNLPGADGFKSILRAFGGDRRALSGLRVGQGADRPPARLPRRPQVRPGDEPPAGGSSVPGSNFWLRRLPPGTVPSVLVRCEDTDTGGVLLGGGPAVPPHQRPGGGLGAQQRRPVLQFRRAGQQQLALALAS
mmetsp:Transcript_18970/g.71805  ORF Transcript_18970/g.71805 Transcript_18970/m.71805 type:complete len:234 (-) Transcript_18970:170-871(-)